MGETNRVYGYARVSSKEQDLSRQIEALLPYVKDERDIIIDKQSGKDFERKGYQSLKTQFLRSGDTLYIKELDRLGRNYEELKKEYSELVGMGINIVVLDTPMLSTADKSNLEKQLICNLVFEIMGYVAEKERLKIKARCREGISAAKAKGVKFGRPKIERPAEWDKIIAEWRAGKITATEAMKKLGLKRNCFYNFLKEEAQKQVEEQDV